VINAGLNRASPYGDSAVIFFTTGLVPFMCFMYMARYMMTTVQHSRPMLVFPAVKIFDLLAAGAILEVLSSCVMVIVLGASLEVLGYEFWPAEPVEAALAFGVSLLLGLGAGILNGLLVMAMPVWGTVFNLTIIVLYMISGIFFVPMALPEGVRYAMSFNPVMQTIEWMRSAYYDGYGINNAVLDKSYVVSFAVAMIFAGLAIERLFRGRFLVVR
jgi:capsular polysaccharide transport system permease protein